MMPREIDSSRTLSLTLSTVALSLSLFSPFYCLHRALPYAVEMLMLMLMAMVMHFLDGHHSSWRTQSLRRQMTFPHDHFWCC